MRQRLRRGSEKWLKSISRRSAVESNFSNIQSPDGENLAPGTLTAMGFVRNSLLIACLLAATNIRLSRKFAADNDMLDGRHPLLVPDEVDDRWVELNEEAEPPAAA